MSSGMRVKDLNISVSLSQKEFARETKECANFSLLLPFPLNSTASFKLHSEVVASYFFLHTGDLLCITETNINGSGLIPPYSLAI